MSTTAAASPASVTTPAVGASAFHAEFELTNHCNTRCLHCPHEVMTRPRGRLEWDTYRTVVDKIRDHVRGQRFSLSFSGMGEPLLHPQLPEFVRYVSGDAMTSFATNGAALTEANVARLIESGLDLIYVSFNGDEPELFSRMMGGLDLGRVTKNLRRAVALSRGTRLKISANISVTKANRGRLTQIVERLRDEGVTGISFAMAHTRGGNLRDPAVFDTPPVPGEVTHCDVLRDTLFIDWRGRVFICDHDIHGEHTLGDLTTAPLAEVLARRQRLIDAGVDFAICHACHDVLKMGTSLFPDLRSGTLRDWIYDVYRTDLSPPSPAANPRLQWLHGLYQREGRTDRMMNRLLDRIHLLQEDAKRPRPEAIGHELAERDTRIHELNLELIARDRRIAELDAQARGLALRLEAKAAERKRWKRSFVWPLLAAELWLRSVWPKF